MFFKIKDIVSGWFETPWYRTDKWRKRTEGAGHKVVEEHGAGCDVMLVHMEVYQHVDSGETKVRVTPSPVKGTRFIPKSREAIEHQKMTVTIPKYLARDEEIRSYPVAKFDSDE